MNKTALAIAVYFFAAISSGFAADKPMLIYWDSADAQPLRARIAADADFWPLSATFAVQETQTFCSVASAITVLNALPIEKPVDTAYTPYPYFTQRNFFTPEVTQIINADAVLAMGMTREQMAQTLSRHGVEALSIAGDSFDNDSLRSLLQKTLGDDGHFVLVNYARGNLEQVGGGHWSVLAAFDAETDRALILDVAKYKYPPVWVGIDRLREAMATLDTTSNQSRGLVIVNKKDSDNMQSH
jgi:hypothetical protein